MPDKTVLVGIARMGSTRLPGKVLFPLGELEQPVLAWIERAANQATLVDQFVVATTTDPRDDEIEQWCKSLDITCYRGSEDDVLERFYYAAMHAGASVAVRVTCDCPFVSPQVIDQVIALRDATGADYASNIDPPTWPDGLDCEAIAMPALRDVLNCATSKIDRECVTTYIQANRDMFHCETLICPLPDMHKERWVLDTDSDYELCQKIAHAVPDGNWLMIKKYLDANPILRKINANHPRNERFYAGLAQENANGSRSYHVSKALLRRAEAIIPLGAQTFSKSRIQYPEDSPLFVSHGDGGYCFDVDGNRYVDLVGGLLPVILGHRDPDVDYAIRRQLCCGISHSLSTRLEAELAELICQLIPSAEMVRFGKTGTDVTTAAIRLAREATGRQIVLISGYHGWADWTVATDPVRNAGTLLGHQTMRFQHGDRTIFDHLSGAELRNLAAVIIEPESDPDWLRWLRSRCSDYGALLIFDEIITWPRWGLGGAQGQFKVTPDLTCISKAMANGMPISALVGPRGLMSHMEDICFSGTFFGETLSLAAAIATIKKLRAENVVERIRDQSTALTRKLTCFHGQYDSFIGWEDTGGLCRLCFKSQGDVPAAAIKTLFVKEMAQAGTLIIASHNLSFAHREPEVTRIMRSYDYALSVVQDALQKGDIEQRIGGRLIPVSANVRAA